jgi:hypothetical protein
MNNDLNLQLYSVERKQPIHPDARIFLLKNGNLKWSITDKTANEFVQTIIRNPRLYFFKFSPFKIFFPIYIPTQGIFYVYRQFTGVIPTVRQIFIAIEETAHAAMALAKSRTPKAKHNELITLDMFVVSRLLVRKNNARHVYVELLPK